MLNLRESEPFYGEKTDLSLLFSSLDSPSIDGDCQEGEKEASETKESDSQPRRMGIVIGTTPCSMNEPNYTCVGEPHQDGENSNVHNVPI
jgi:hypothetical protein